MLGIGELVVSCLLAGLLLFKALPLGWALAVVFAVVSYVHYYFDQQRSYWKRRGIDGPQGNLLTGTTFIHRRGQHELDEEWTKQYGRTFGFRLLGKQVLMISDLDSIRKVLVKDFGHFVNRTNFMRDKNHTTKLSLFPYTLIAKEDDEWKNIRNTITPAFTSGKIRNMIGAIDQCANTFCEVVGEFADKNQKIPLKEICGRATLDVISRTALGIQSNVQQDDSEPLLTHAKNIFSIQGMNWRVMLITLFPNVVFHLQEFFGRLFVNHETNQFYINILSDLLEKRQHEKDDFSVDFFKLLLASLEEDSVPDAVEDSDIIHDEISDHKGKKKLSKFDIMGQAFIFLLAGYETTATTLHFIIFMLAHHSSIQERCRQEVSQIVGDKDVQYDHVMKLKYIDQVIAETLRMFPPTARTSRDCNEDIEIEGIKIEKGTAIFVPIYMIHHDEKHYPHPEIFDPDRFSPEEKAKRDPLTYLPFGYGPRNCIGLRLAQFELKVLLAEAVRMFRFTPVEGEPGLPIEIDTQGLTKPKKTLHVKAERI